MEIHEAANLLPLDEENVADLAADLREYGQRESIKVFQGKILDGRRRWTACQRAGVQPRIEEVQTDDPVAYVLSLNLHRRHLTPSQRAMVGARAREWYDRQAKERQRLSEGRGQKKGKENIPDLNQGQARDQVGKTVGVSGKYIDYATKVQREAVPEIIKAVDEGRMSLDTAAILCSEPPEVQTKEATSGKRNRNYKSISKPLDDQGKEANGTNRHKEEEEKSEPETPKRKGIGVICAHEAINCLIRIPKNDQLRKRGFQIVTDWIRSNQ